MNNNNNRRFKQQSVGLPQPFTIRSSDRRNFRQKLTKPTRLEGIRTAADSEGPRVSQRRPRSHDRNHDRGGGFQEVLKVTGFVALRSRA
jgi:hypothetical protein